MNLLKINKNKIFGDAINALLLMLKEIMNVKSVNSLNQKMLNNKIQINRKLQKMIDGYVVAVIFLIIQTIPIVLDVKQINLKVSNISI